MLSLGKAYIDLCLLNRPKRSSFRSLLLNFLCMHQTGFSSAAVAPQSKFAELCSWAAVVSQSKSSELCKSAAVVPKSKSTELCSSAAPFDHDL